jgi:hypothetical protein
MEQAFQDPMMRFSQHRDPLTGAPGAHPVGTGVGAAVGGAAAGVALGTAGVVATGAAIGAAAGPVGAVVGALAGGLAGGFVGHRVAESMHPTMVQPVKVLDDPGLAEEEIHWQERYLQLPYVLTDLTFTDYLPAFRFGRECRTQYPDRRFEDVEGEMRSGWKAARGDSPLDWEDARHAIRDAFEESQPRPESIPEPDMIDPWMLPPL